jgi:hypothetical protein
MPLARISGAYISWPMTGDAWNLPRVADRNVELSEGEIASVIARVGAQAAVAAAKIKQQVVALACGINFAICSECRIINPIRRGPLKCRNYFARPFIWVIGLFARLGNSSKDHQWFPLRLGIDGLYGFAVCGCDFKDQRSTSL